MLKRLLIGSATLTGLLAANVASAYVITAQSDWNGQASVSTNGVTITACNTGGPGTCTSPGTIGIRDIPTVGIGAGVTGQGNNEIDWYQTADSSNSEMLRFQFGTATVIDSLQLGLLFDGPEYTDFQEQAKFRVTFSSGETNTFTLAALYSPTGGNYAWNGGGSWTGTGMHVNQAGLWTALNPFGNLSVLRIDMLASQGTCGTLIIGNRCGDQSDYVFRSLTATSVPEPGTLALLGAGLLGLGVASRRRKRAA